MCRVYRICKASTCAGALTADENGNYTVKLTASEQKINVTLNGLTQPYAFSASKRVANGADKLVDYLCINSRHRWRRTVLQSSGHSSAPGSLRRPAAPASPAARCTAAAPGTAR